MAWYDKLKKYITPDNIVYAGSATMGAGIIASLGAEALLKHRRKKLTEQLFEDPSVLAPAKEVLRPYRKFIKDNGIRVTHTGEEYADAVINTMQHEGSDFYKLDPKDLERVRSAYVEHGNLPYAFSSTPLIDADSKKAVSAIVHLPLKGPNKDLLPVLPTQHEFGHVQEFFSRPNALVGDDLGIGDAFKALVSPRSTKRYQTEVKAWDNAGVPEDNPARKAALASYSAGLRTPGALISSVVVGMGLMGVGALANVYTTIKGTNPRYKKK